MSIRADINLLPQNMLILGDSYSRVLNEIGIFSPLIISILLCIPSREDLLIGKNFQII